MPLRSHNRWGGFKALRATWPGDLETTRRRAVLLVDEAREMSPAVLNELRLLASARFDSQPLLCVVLAGDTRLTDHLRREELLACLQHLCASAGNTALMSEPLKHTLCDHAAGNHRILATLAAELLAVAAQHERPQLDDALFLEVFHPARHRDPAAGRPATLTDSEHPRTRPQPQTLQPLGLPPLPEADAVALMDVLHEIVFQVEGHYFHQLRRDHAEHLRVPDLFDGAPDFDDPLWF